MAEKKDSERQVEPRLSPQLADLRERLRARTHDGEPFEVTVTNKELEEAIAWCVERRPSIPFRNPQVSIDPNGVEARGEVHLGTLRLPLGGRANMFLQDGLPVITVQQLEVGKAGLPDLVLLQVQTQLNKRLNIRGDLPVIIEAIELEEGQVTVRGKIR